MIEILVRKLEVVYRYISRPGFRGILLPSIGYILVKPVSLATEIYRVVKRDDKSGEINKNAITLSIVL